MTDRIHSLTLTLAHDISEDDIEALVNACRQLRRVIDVTPNVSSDEVHVAETRARYRLTSELLELVNRK